MPLRTTIINHTGQTAMKSDTALLNKILTTTLTSINRYFLHARMYKNWGIEKLNEISYKKSIQDMKNADSLMERILFLEGLPNLQHLEALQVGEHTEEMISCDMKFELAYVSQLKNGIHECELLQDYVSRDLLTEILEDEEGYIDTLEAQQYQIKNITIQNFLQAYMSDED